MDADGGQCVCHSPTFLPALLFSFNHLLYISPPGLPPSPPDPNPLPPPLPTHLVYPRHPPGSPLGSN